MKISEAENICSDFLPIRKQGNIVCKFLLDQELCKLSNKFRCELKIYKEQKEKEQRISVSKINLYEYCPRAWQLKYYFRVEPVVIPDWKVLGRAFAIARAKIQSNQEYSIEYLKDIKGEAYYKLFFILEEYKKLKLPETKSERFVLIDLDNISILGYPDGITLDNKTIYEWKYAQSMDTYNRLSVARQASIYFGAIPEAKEFILALAKKTRHTLNKNETIEQFKERIEKTYKDQKELFEFKTFFREEFDIPNEITYVLHVYSNIQKSIETKIFPPNYANCDNCEWFEFCEKHPYLLCNNNNNCEYRHICKSIMEKL